MATKILMFGRSRDDAGGSFGEVDDVLVVDDVATALDADLVEGFLDGERDVAGMAPASGGGLHNLCHRVHLC